MARARGRVCSNSANDHHRYPRLAKVLAGGEGGGVEGGRVVGSGRVGSCGPFYAKLHLHCTPFTPAFTLGPHTTAFCRFSPRYTKAFQVLRAFVDLALEAACVVAAIDHGGLHGGRFLVHLYSAPANVTGVFGPKSPAADVFE